MLVNSHCSNQSFSSSTVSESASVSWFQSLFGICSRATYPEPIFEDGRDWNGWSKGECCRLASWQTPWQSVEYFSWLVVPPFDHPVFLPQIIPPVLSAQQKSKLPALWKPFNPDLSLFLLFILPRKKKEKIETPSSKHDSFIQYRHESDVHDR